MRRTPSLSTLRLFLKVARSLSFSETARNANVSQPALSRTIRMLEEDLGVRLFDRDTRKVNLTSAGEALLPIVEKLTTEFDHEFQELALSFAGQRGRITIGAMPLIAAVILPSLIAEFSRTHPQVEILIHDGLVASLYQGLKDRELDFVIATPPEPETPFTFEPLLTDEYVMVCRKGDPLDTGEKADWSIFATAPFIAMAQGTSVRQLTDAALAKAGVTATPLYQCGQLATVGSLIEVGLGISALPRNTLALMKGAELAWRPLEPQTGRIIGISVFAQRSLSPSAAEFVSRVREYAAAQPIVPPQLA